MPPTRANSDPGIFPASFSILELLARGYKASTKESLAYSLLNLLTAVLFAVILPTRVEQSAKYIAILAGVINFLPHPNPPRSRGSGVRNLQMMRGLL